MPTIRVTRTEWRQHLEIIQHQDVARAFKEVNGFRGTTLPHYTQIRPLSK
jgi:hypothetical protein